MNPQDDASPLQSESLDIINKKRRMDPPDMAGTRSKHHDHLSQQTDSSSLVNKRLRSARPLSQSTHIPAVPTAIFERLSVTTASVKSSSKKRHMEVDYDDDDDDDDGECPPCRAMKRLRMVDGGSSSCSSSSTTNSASNPQAASSTSATMPLNLPALMSLQQPMSEPAQKTPPTEPTDSVLNQYLQVNHVLGMLHLERQRRLQLPTGSTIHDVETPRGSTIVSGMNIPRPNKNHKKMVQLRTSSKLG